jgi:hypothetical protein
LARRLFSQGKERKIFHFLLNSGYANPTWARTVSAVTVLSSLLYAKPIHKLPRFGYFYQQFHRGIPDTLPFIQHGFTTELLFTYEVMPAPEETI